MKLTLQEMRYALSGQPEFRFAEYEGMTVGCYMIADETSFLTNYGRECRGVTFDTATGRCIGRPFPKFFNVNERPDTQAGVIDWSKLAHVYEKRDGSLIHTVDCVEREGRFRLKCKKSFTAPQAVAAEAWLLNHDSMYCEWVASMVDMNYTVIFEWTAPDNRVVVPYAEPQLTVLACRGNDTGVFLPRDQLELFAMEVGFPLVESMHYADHTYHGNHELLDLARSVEGFEGWVLQFEDGTLLKLKTQWYLDRHHYMTELRERDVARAVLHETIDDIKTKIPAEDTSAHKSILRVEQEVVADLESIMLLVDTIDDQYRANTAKETAIALRNHELFTLIMAKKNGKEPQFKKWFEKCKLDELWGLDLVTSFGSRGAALP